MNFDALFSYATSRALAEKSKERALSMISLRRLWHIVFDPCPKLSTHFGDRNRDFLEPFLEHAAQNELSMRWPLHAQLLLWMKLNRSNEIEPEISRELLAACAARWANTDLSGNKGVLLYFSDAPESAIAGWKMRSVEEDSRVVLVSIPKQALPSFSIFCSIVRDYAYPNELQWRPIPD